jgi:hypothetical protein
MTEQEQQEQATDTSLEIHDVVSGTTSELTKEQQDG